MPNFESIEWYNRLYLIWWYFIRELRGRDTWGTARNLQVDLNTPKNPYLNQVTPKKYLPNLPIQKKSRNRKFQHPPSPPQNPSIIPLTWNPESPPPLPPPVYIMHFLHLTQGARTPFLWAKKIIKCIFLCSCHCLYKSFWEGFESHQRSLLNNIAGYQMRICVCLSGAS